MAEWTQHGIVAKDMRSGKVYSEIDFNDLENIEAYENKQDSGLTINLKMPEKIRHTFPPIDRCCQSNGKRIKFDGIDNMERIHCNISSKLFQNKYVDKRKPVILTGCQKGWKAQKWTFGNLFGRYVSKWPLSYYHHEKEDCFAGSLSGPQVYYLMKNSTYFKSFTQLQKSKIAQVKDDSEKEYYKLDLLEEYALPSPFPKDEFENFDMESDQNYLMLSSKETGFIIWQLFLKFYMNICKMFLFLKVL